MPFTLIVESVYGSFFVCCIKNNNNLLTHPPQLIICCVTIIMNYSVAIDCTFFFRSSSYKGLAVCIKKSQAGSRAARKNSVDLIK